tara:strand:- start:31624 stop:32880 length:1257 start_codon:yes stop_codon:yes gene_type:complete
MEIQSIHKLYKETCLIDTDTRKIRKGSVFFALKGDNFNGNKFVKQALDSGSRYCIIDEEEYYIDNRTILVEDSLKTLQFLANYHRKELAIPIIALTGSNGKTTTKELINIVLETQFNTTATFGNLNNHIGVPLTILSMNSKTEIGILEMGANHLKEIEFLSEIAEPDYGYITNFGKAHLEGFGSVDGVIKGKSELYQYLIKNNKIIFVNPNDQKQMEITKGAERVLLNTKETLLSSTHPFLKISYQDTVITTNLVGIYNFTNILAAISIGEYFKISKDNIKNAIENYTPTNNRSQIIKTKNNTILLDAYNANPTSVELALQSFNKIKHSNKIVILGDMFELGKESQSEHQNIVDLTSEFIFSKALFVGENFYKSSANTSFLNFEELKVYLDKNAILDSYILIKGSRGMALERLLGIIN